MNELEGRIHYLVSSLGGSSSLPQRSRSEALKAASLFRQGSTQHALRQSRQVLKNLSDGELRHWRNLLAAVIEDIDTDLLDAPSR